jgi:hypothetical protein
MQLNSRMRRVGQDESSGQEIQCANAGRWERMMRYGGVMVRGSGCAVSESELGSELGFSKGEMVNFKVCRAWVRLGASSEIVRGF